MRQQKTSVTLILPLDELTRARLWTKAQHEDGLHHRLHQEDGHILHLWLLFLSKETKVPSPAGVSAPPCGRAGQFGLNVDHAILSVWEGGETCRGDPAYLASAPPIRGMPAHVSVCLLSTSNTVTPAKTRDVTTR